MVAYYNENDSQAAAWLRELIKNGLIAHGDVDERDIRDVPPADLGGYTQCHFFAGIGGWSYALRLAGWPDDKPVWTGSCPCQPFSTAGRGKGVTDERHLWPHFHWLIEQCRPSVVFGEQVASKDGLAWLDLVQTDLEGAGYAVGAADLCGAGVGAPNIRQRLYWVADTHRQRCNGVNALLWQKQEHLPETSRSRSSGGLANAESSRWRKEQQNRRRRDAGVSTGKTFGRSGGGSSGGLGDGFSPRLERYSWDGDRTSGWPKQDRPATETGTLSNFSQTDGFWRDADWLYCRDGKWRPVEPGTFPLAHGVPARVGRLRGYGNAIVPQVAQTFIEAYLETNGDNNERGKKSAG